MWAEFLRNVRGTATNVTHVDNYEAGTLYYYYVNNSRSIIDRVVNQSFIFCNADYSHLPVSTEQQIDQQYDNYAAQYKILLFPVPAMAARPIKLKFIRPPAVTMGSVSRLTEEVHAPAQPSTMAARNRTSQRRPPKRAFPRRKLPVAAAVIEQADCAVTVAAIPMTPPTSAR